MTDPRSAPYPEDTRAKGWRFELDHERMDQSDTWALAGDEWRPWLLMLWLTAWKQAPIGSLPSDETIVAAKIGMPTKLWAKARPILLRGWWLADDGRLYHDVIAQRVVEMLTKKEKDRQRKGAWRSGQSADVPRDKRVTPADETVTAAPETATSDVAPTGKTPPSTKHQAPISLPAVVKTAARSLSVADLVGEGIPEKYAADWLKARGKVPLTETAWEGLVREAKKAGMTPSAAVQMSAERGWRGFRADWAKTETRKVDAIGAGNLAVVQRFKERHG